MLKKILTTAIVTAMLTIGIVAKEITIGTGGITGVYYPTGNSICRLVNRDTKKHGITCSAEATGGSIYNLNSIRAREHTLGVVQSDWQYHAYNGTDKFKKKGAFKELRAIFSLHAEPFTVVARKNANIQTLRDLEGKRVNIGNLGSGQRGTMEVLMRVMNWTKETFKVASELKSAEQSKALCDNKIDAMVFTVGHPSGSIKEATNSCECELIEVTGEEVNKLVKEHNYYRWVTIPKGMYKGTYHDIKTFGVGATLVTSEKVSEEIIYNVVKAVFDNFEAFKKLHPAFANLKKEEMIKDSLSAPLHKGAVRYYKEIGLLK